MGGTGGISWVCCEYERDVVRERGSEWDDDERADGALGVLSWLSAGPSTLLGIGSLLTSIPVMSFIPTPKKRESLAARRRRMRNIGSEGLASDAFTGLAKAGEMGEAGARWDIGGEAGADTDPE